MHVTSKNVGLCDYGVKMRRACDSRENCSLNLLSFMVFLKLMRIYLHFWRNECRGKETEKKENIQKERRSMEQSWRTHSQRKTRISLFQMSVCLMLGMNVNGKVCHLSSSILKCLRYAWHEHLFNYRGANWRWELGSFLMLFYCKRDKQTFDITFHETETVTETDIQRNNNKTVNIDVDGMECKFEHQEFIHTYFCFDAHNANPIGYNVIVQLSLQVDWKTAEECVCDPFRKSLFRWSEFVSGQFRIFRHATNIMQMCFSRPVIQTIDENRKT